MNTPARLSKNSLESPFRRRPLHLRNDICSPVSRNQSPNESICFSPNFEDSPTSDSQGNRSSGRMSLGEFPLISLSTSLRESVTKKSPRLEPKSIPMKIEPLPPPKENSPERADPVLSILRHISKKRIILPVEDEEQEGEERSKKKQRLPRHDLSASLLESQLTPPVSQKRQRDEGCAGPSGAESTKRQCVGSAARSNEIASSLSSSLSIVPPHKRQSTTPSSSEIKVKCSKRSKKQSSNMIYFNEDEYEASSEQVAAQELTRREEKELTRREEKELTRREEKEPTERVDKAEQAEQPRGTSSPPARPCQPPLTNVSIKPDVISERVVTRAMVSALLRSAVAKFVLGGDSSIRLEPVKSLGTERREPELPLPQFGPPEQESKKETEGERSAGSAAPSVSTSGPTCHALASSPLSPITFTSTVSVKSSAPAETTSSTPISTVVKFPTVAVTSSTPVEAPLMFKASPSGQTSLVKSNSLAAPPLMFGSGSSDTSPFTSTTGVTTTAISVTTTACSSPKFSFGATTTGSPVSFGWPPPTSASTKTTPTSTFMFGGPISTPATSAPIVSSQVKTNLFRVNTTGSAPTVPTATTVSPFGSLLKVATTTASQTLFGMPPASSAVPAFSFKPAATTTTVTATTLQGSENEKAAGTFTGSTSSLIQFGASVTSARATTTAPTTTVSFGSTTTTTTTTTSTLFGASQLPSFGVSQSSATPLFGTGNTPSFGNLQSSSTPTFGTAQSGSTVSFGTAQTATTLSFGTAQTGSTPSFGTAQGSTPSFGNTQSSSTPSFGSTTATVTAIPMFGNVEKTSSAFTAPSTTTAATFGPQSTPFGGTPVTTASIFANRPSTSNSVFGSTTTTSGIFGSTTTAASSVFSSTATTTTSSTPMFGSSSFTSGKPFEFGSGSTQTKTGGFAFNLKQGESNAAFGPTPTFGSTTQPSATRAFGSATSTTPAFGSSGASPAIPSFGPTSQTTGITGFSAGQSTVTPAFGISGQSATPAFGSNQTTATPTFGSTTAPSFGSQAPAASTFNFSGTNQTPGFQSGSQPSTFVFGSGSAAPAAASKPFQFGSPTPNFTSPTPAFGSATPTPAFQFNAVPQQPQGAGGQPMFSIGSGSSQTSSSRLRRDRRRR